MIPYFVDLEFSNLDNLTLYGNITGTLELGNTHSNVQESVINISGNVEAINWYKKELIHNAYTGTDYYTGFAGTVVIDGSVNTGAIYSLFYDAALDSQIWKKTGTFGVCETGTFQMTTGVLAEAVTVKEIVPQPGNYKFQYTISNNGNCVKAAYDAETGASIAIFACEVSDIPDGATVSILSTAPGKTG